VSFFHLTDGVVELRDRAWGQAFSGKQLLDLNNKPLRFQLKSYRAQLYTLGRKLIPDVPLSAGAKWLFNNVKSRSTSREKNLIFEVVSNVLDRNGDLIAGIKDPEKAIYDISIYPVDLNKDGSEEIFLCYSYKGDFGRAANTLLAIIKNNTCAYVPCLNFLLNFLMSFIQLENIYRH